MSYQKLFKVDIDKWKKESGNANGQCDGVTYFNMIKRFLRDVLKLGKGRYQRRYKYAKGCDSGRIYVEGFGIQSLSCNVKKFICQGTEYIDYDMINAHPNILRYLMKKLGINFHFLNEYCVRRGEVLEEHNMTKLDVIVAMYSDVVQTTNTWLQCFHEEICQIRAVVNNIHRDVFKSCSISTGNPESSKLSKVLCHFENEILQKVMRKYANDVAVPYYDGFLSKRRIPLGELNKMTVEYGIQWSIKSMANEIVVGDDVKKKPYDQKVLMNLLGQTYAGGASLSEALYYFNEYFFVVTDGDAIYGKDVYDAKSGRVVDRTMYKKKSGFINCHEHLFYYEEQMPANTRTVGTEKRPRKKRFVDEWLRWSKRREYTKQDFVIGEDCPDDTLNLWLGWKHEFNPKHEVDRDIIKPLQGHLRDIVCGGKEKQYDYMMKRWKAILKGKKTGVANCIVGDYGCGKNICLEWFGREILGERYFAYVEGTQGFTDNFNANLANKCYIVADEVSVWSSGKSDSQNILNTIKSRITCEQDCIERKGIDKVYVQSKTNVDFLSNYKNCISITNKNERRFNMIECSDAVVGNVAYFRKLALDVGLTPHNQQYELTKAQVEHKNKVAYDFYHHLMTEVDCSAWDPKDFLKFKTKLRIQLEQRGTPGIVCFVRWFLQHVQDDLLVADGKPMYPVKEVFNLYLEFCRQHGYRNVFTACNKFSNELYIKFPFFKACRQKVARDTKKRKRGVYYSMNGDTVVAQLTKIDKSHSVSDDVISWEPEAREKQYIDRYGCPAKIVEWEPPRIYTKYHMFAEERGQGGVVLSPSGQENKQIWNKEQDAGSDSESDDSLLCGDDGEW